MAVMKYCTVSATLMASPRSSCSSVKGVGGGGGSVVVGWLAGNMNKVGVGWLLVGGWVGLDGLAAVVLRQ